MIELPEAATIAGQVDADLTGKTVAAVERGNSPHKFAFCTGSPDEYAAMLVGKSISGAEGLGNHVVVAVERDLALVLGGGGERILFHAGDKTLPKKRHLLLRFSDGTYLTVSVQGWGAVQCVPREDLATRTFVGPGRVSPLDEAFSPAYWEGLFAGLEPGDPRAVKFLLISKPGVWGLGNGYLQDILFHGGLHPRRRAVDLTPDERRALYDATVRVLREATALGGRDSERDLYDRPGGYQKVLDSTTLGEPCPRCGGVIEKFAFLGGACYVCPACQPL